MLSFGSPANVRQMRQDREPLQAQDLDRAPDGHLASLHRLREEAPEAEFWIPGGYQELQRPPPSWVLDDADVADPSSMTDDKENTPQCSDPNSSWSGVANDCKEMTTPTRLGRLEEHCLDLPDDTPSDTRAPMWSASQWTVSPVAGEDDVPRHMSGGGACVDAGARKARHFFFADLLSAATSFSPVRQGAAVAPR